MNEILFRLLEKAIRHIKDKSYHIDRRIPIASIIRIFIDRLISLLRSVAHGFNPLDQIFFGNNITIHSKRLFNAERGTSIGSFSYINALSSEGIKLGKNVSIGAYCRLEASGTITDIGKGIVIGNNSGMGAYSFIGGAGGVKIGSDVIMGQWVSFHSENHNFDNVDIPIRLQGINRKGIVIEDDCWIGAKATFLDGAHVGHGSVIAAGALVRGYIPPYSIAAGVPARVIRTRNATNSVI